jgi:sel1 repeat
MRTLLLVSSFFVLFSANGVEIPYVHVLEQSGNYPDAFELCKKTPDDVFSLYFIGDYLYHGRKGINQAPMHGRESYRRAIPELAVLAKAGNVDAQYFLGRCYEYGQNNFKLAREWYIKAADNGNSDAMVKAAMFIAKRKGGGKKEPARVMTYIQKAIRSGNPDGKALLASFYLEDRKDIEKGIKLAKEASDAGSPLGQMILGSLYLQGIGSISKDEQKAIELFQLSSDQGNSMINDFLRQIKSKNKSKL